MDKQHFFIKLIPPRPTFPQDMTDSEREIMQRHIGYWKKLVENRTAIVFGPVFDPAGGYGMGIVEVTDKEEANDILANDPTILANCNCNCNCNFSFEIFPMRIGMIRE